MTREVGQTAGLLDNSRTLTSRRGNGLVTHSKMLDAQLDASILSHQFHYYYQRLYALYRRIETCPLCNNRNYLMERRDRTHLRSSPCQT